MNNNAYWIWKRCDFENYHSLYMHSRRTEFGVEYPPFWQMTPPSVRLNFLKEYSSDCDFEIKVFHTGIGYLILDEREMFDINNVIKLPAGEHRVRVAIQTFNDFPTIYIDDCRLKTDNTWLVCEPLGECENASYSRYFTSFDKKPTQFPFEYKQIEPTTSERLQDGILFDFGEETFAKVKLSNLNPNEKTVLYYGESRSEACDHSNTLVFNTTSGKTEAEFYASAFRYLYLKCNNAENVKITAHYEYLPIKDKASFECDNPFFKQIWDVCAYTFHLCSREFLIDGIKRDRWCWGGDAYESYLCDYYLYFDKESVTRTLNLLIGNGKFNQHVNTIPDYTFLTVIGVWDYYLHTGDIDYVKLVYPQLETIYNYCYTRLNNEGFVDNFERDWIFIDWSDDLDKDGAMSAEQILLWKMNVVMADLCSALGIDGDKFIKSANILREKIISKYWNEARGGFIDSYTSGKEKINRQANTFAIIFDFADDIQKTKILNNVLLNQEIPPIVTPYFKFFELVALGMMGRIDIVQNEIEDYWGGMIKLGATTIWEMFNPNEKDNEHYAMYSKAYGRSLCHAWGGGPIYLLGRFCAGVYPTSPGYKTFKIVPQKGKFNNFTATVPINNSVVNVKYGENSITVLCECDGGELVLDEKSYKILKGKPLTINF